MLLIVFILLFSFCENVPTDQCNLANQFAEKITGADLIIVGRILNLANNDGVVSVFRILKGFELINQVKKLSHNNDYHLILVMNMKIISNCKMLAKAGEDYVFYLKKTNQPNFFELQHAREFGDGSFEKQISSFINGGASRVVQNNDPCSKLNCKFGAQCQKWPGNPPTAVCHCSTTPCPVESKVNRICGSDGSFYESECHKQRQECILQKSINTSPISICDSSVVVTQNAKKDLQQDEISQSTSQLCQDLKCPHYAQCITNPYPHCKCPTDKCTPNSPVICGSDEITYTNICELKIVSCKAERFIEQQYEGRCDRCKFVKCEFNGVCEMTEDGGSTQCKCPNPAEACSQINRVAVCGSDDVTYESECHMKIESCRKTMALSVVHKEPCKPKISKDSCFNKPCLFGSKCVMKPGNLAQCSCDEIDCDRTSQDYICGDDGETYLNKCLFEKAKCEKQKEIQIINQGRCDACQNKKCSFYSICRMNRFGDPQCICPTDCVYLRKPVCGSDGRTYENNCFLKVKSCAESRPISVVSKGPCKTCPKTCPFGQMCKEGMCVCTDKCSKLKLQVCGSDGNYYENECELKRQACLQKKTIRTDLSKSSCVSREFISDENGSGANKIINKFNWSGKSCNCNKMGSVSSECDPHTFQCKCKIGFTGQPCDKCKEGYWNMSESGCTACSCNKFGSESIQCTAENGQCKCKGRALGKYCSVCPPGFSMSNDGCKETSFNENKIDAVELGFMKDSYAKSYWSGNAEKYLSINISFVPYSSDGIILYHSDPILSSDFLAIILKDKFIEFRLDLGSGMLVLKSNRQIILGRSHTILAERFNRHARLIVDENDFQYGMSPSYLTSLDAGVIFLIGQIAGSGWQSHTLNHTNNLSESFIGCLSSLNIVAGQETNIFLMNQQTSWIFESSNVKPNCPHIDFKQNVNVIEESDRDEHPEKENPVQKDYCEVNQPCLNGGICKSTSYETYNCHCLPGYQGYTCEDLVSPIWKFRDDSFIIFPSESLQLRQRLKLEIIFLPISGNGLLLFISDGHDRNPAFISVILNQNRVEVTCRTPIGVTKLTSAEVVNISKWNQVVILKAAKYVYLNLNQTPQPIKKRLIPKGFMNVDPYVRRKLTQFRITGQPIFLGGVDTNNYNRFSNVVSLKPNYQGAIQKIIINDENIRFQNSDIIFHNITQWQGAPCGPLHNKCPKTDSEKSYCIADMDKFSCSCNPKFEHLCIRNSMQQDNPSNTNFNRKFMGESAAKYTAVKQKRNKSSTKNNIRLKFKTDTSDGLIVLLKKIYNSKKHFLVIAIRNSIIEIAINLGGKNGTIRIGNKKKVSDNKWHTVQVIRNNRNVVLLVDNRMFRANMPSDPAHNTLETDGWMWLGGPKKPVEGFPWEYNTNFKGCIAELYVDEVAYNLVNDARKNIGPVLKC